MLRKRARASVQGSEYQKAADKTIGHIQLLRTSLEQLQSVLQCDSQVKEVNFEAADQSIKSGSDLDEQELHSVFEGRKDARIHEDLVQLVSLSPDEISFGCVLCDLTFKKRWELKRHQNQSHKPIVHSRFQRIEGGYNCKICHEFQQTRETFNLHIWNAHFQERVEIFYRQEASILVPEYARTKSLQLFIKKQIQIFQGIDQGLLAPDAKLHTEDKQWLLQQKPVRKLDYMKNVFSNRDMRPLQLLWMRINHQEEVYLEQLLVGRSMTQTEDRITVAYPLKDCCIPGTDQIDDSVLREISTLESLRLSIRELYPQDYYLYKNYDAIYIQFKVNGKSLRSIIDDKKLMQTHGIQIFRMLLGAVKNMYKRGYAHRNICPENIIISADFQSIQLVGFDKACHKDRKEALVRGCQKPYWQPMDKWWSQSTFRWDLMHASIVFYEMMETKRFFHVFRESQQLNKNLQISTRFHQFTKLHDLMYGLMTYGEIPSITNHEAYIKSVLDDSKLIEFEGGLKAFNLSNVYEPSTSNISKLMLEQPHWSHV